MNESTVKQALESFKVVPVLNHRKLYVDNTEGFDIGMDISFSETLTLLERIKRFFRLTSAPVYEIVAKDAYSLTVAPTSTKTGKIIEKWSFFAPSLSDIVTFKRPIPYVSDC